MSSIVLELQKGALDPTVNVSDLLRRALLIATKLDIPDFKLWVENELGGYRDSKTVPPYRTVTGQVWGQDEWGRSSEVLFATSLEYERVARVNFSDSVAELEALMQRAARENSPNLCVDFSPEIAAILRRHSQYGLVRHTRLVRTEDLKGVLDSVRTEILRWSLKLEKSGILGEGMTFSLDEQRRASSVQYNTHFHGSVGNVAQNAEHFHQTANIGMGSEDLARLVRELSAHLGDLALDDRQNQRAIAQIAILRNELAGEPDTEIVIQAGRTLWNITQGAIGSLLADAAVHSATVWQWIQLKLSTL